MYRSRTGTILFDLNVPVFVGSSTLIGLLVRPFGSRRIGGADARPEFSHFGWLAMLFSARMEIDLMFCSVVDRRRTAALGVSDQFFEFLSLPGDASFYIASRT